MNAYEEKVGIMLFAGKTVRSMSERFETMCSINCDIYEYSSFLFPFLSILERVFIVFLWAIEMARPLMSIMHVRSYGRPTFTLPVISLC